jgi:hypothetical protein
MVRINNSDAIQELRKAAQISGSEAVPNFLSSSVVPVIEMNPRMLRVCNIVRSSQVSSTTGTLFTTPANQDFYLVSANFSLIKNVTADDANGNTSLNVIIDGATVGVIRIPCLTLTAMQSNMSAVFPFPIKVDRNTAITITKNAITAGNSVICGSIAGYTVENSNG